MTQRLVWNFEFSSKKSLPLSKVVHEPEELKWEMRFFWNEDQIISLYNIDDALLDLTNYKQKHKEDYYYLLPGGHYNIKRRRDELLYKPNLQQNNHAVGFGPKVNLAEVHDPFLQKIADQIPKEGIEICVKKESFTYKFSTTPSTKLVLERLRVNKKVYFSLCIEGKSLSCVEIISEHLLDQHLSCDYVTFLKSIIKS